MFTLWLVLGAVCLVGGFALGVLLAVFVK